MKKNVFLGLLLILTVFSFFFSCGGDDEPEIYTVTIGTLTNANGSTITANPTSGVEGTEITLTIIGDNTYRLKHGTLQYNSITINETFLKFTLPKENVIITADFSSLLVGDWKNEEQSAIYSFYEGGSYFIYIKQTEKYCSKGSWIPLNNDTVLITETHYNVPGVSSINDFTNYDIIIPIDEIYSVLSDTKIKFQGSDYFLNKMIE